MPGGGARDFPLAHACAMFKKAPDDAVSPPDERSGPARSAYIRRRLVSLFTGPKGKCPLAWPQPGALGQGRCCVWSRCGRRRGPGLLPRLPVPTWAWTVQPQ